MLLGLLETRLVCTHGSMHEFVHPLFNKTLLFLVSADCSNLDNSPST